MARTGMIYKALVYGAGLLVAMSLAVVACGALWLWKVRPELEAASTADMLRVLCYDYDDAVKGGRSPSVQDLLAEIDGASVAMCWRDESGTYVDAWGGPVMVTESFEGGARRITGRSHGPDRAAGTVDDIVVVLPPRD